MLPSIAMKTSRKYEASPIVSNRLGGGTPATFLVELSTCDEFLMRKNLTAQNVMFFGVYTE